MRGVQETDRLSDEADHLISEAMRLLRQPTDTMNHIEDDQNAEEPNDEQKKTDMSSEQIFWFRLAKIHMDRKR